MGRTALRPRGHQAPAALCTLRNPGSSAKLQPRGKLQGGVHPSGMEKGHWSMVEGLQEEPSRAETQRLAITLASGWLRDKDLRKPL